MKTFLRISYFLLITLLAGNGDLVAQSPAFTSVTPDSNTVAQFGLFQLHVGLTAAYTNPYDYGDIDLSCVFTAPSGRKDTVDGFFMQDYTLNTSNGSLSPNGTGAFRVRYAPRESGAWQYQLSCTNTLGTTVQPAQTFQCVSAATPGFIRKNNSNYLGFDNGSQYIPIGENMGWQDNNIYTDYHNWVSKLATNKGNYIRVWMPDWGFGLEWLNGSNGYQGLKKYRQDNAFYLDWLVGYCQQEGVYMMLSLDHHGQVSSTTNPEWSSNPYNAVNGGPCANTWDFFTNDSARQLIKNRFRYIVARYGYSPNIMCWELFNEVDWTDNFDTYKSDVTAWHAEMAAFLRSKDVNGHLITTSYGEDIHDPATWNLPGIDFTQTHNYISVPDLESVLSSDCQTYETQYGKPSLNGEFGLSGDGSTLATTDPNGIYVHNSLWGSLFGGGMGTAMTWWWDNYVDPQNLYRHFQPLSNFVSTINLKNDNYKIAAAAVTGGGTSDLSVSPGAGFGVIGSTAFTIDSSGNLSPGPTQLGAYLYGSSYNTQYRSPPVFTVNYPVAGQFKVITGTAMGTTPSIEIWLDGNVQTNQSAAVNTTYAINVPAGAHTIKVDNPGTDWITISNYVFTNIGSALKAYMLRSADTSKVAGWVLNRKYNWQNVESNGIPAAVTGGSVNVYGVRNGIYSVQWSDCLTGSVVSTGTATAAGNKLVVACPTVAWDLSLAASFTTVTAVVDLPSAIRWRAYPNPVTDNLNIEYNLEKRARVSIQLYNSIGQRQAVLFQGDQLPGEQKISVYGNALPALASGVYFLECTIGDDHFMQKIIFERK